MAMMVHEASAPIDQRQCCIVFRNHVTTPMERFLLNVTPSASCKQFHNILSDKLRYMVGTFDLIFIKFDKVKETQVKVTISEKDEENKLETIGFKEDGKNAVEIRERSGIAVEMMCPALPPEDESAFSQTPDPPPYSADIQLSGETGVAPTTRRMAMSNADEKAINLPSSSTAEASKMKMPKLVGLVNQAMTCYLNSLIQTLFMTPEFRNAMYRWECDSTGDISTSIPFQLQHLFLLLQTSSKQSVETTGLTKSFGWDSSEAWQQHDIQELCRVMFDALEKKFEDTIQADLIKKLYEGTMKDYVQCCECSHESARNDTFLDVPVTIRPYGSNKTYKSLIEGLNAFVAPETLDESNQYYCEKCDKKCDAKKGLKFTRFPYLLTLQLKRFDFDYSTMHRIKLNDRMTFPQILNLNAFIDGNESSPSSRDSICEECEENSPDVAADEDSSSHDSGHDLEQVSSTSVANGSEVFQCPQRNSSEEEEEEDVERSSVDEGIDVESQLTSTTHKRRKSNVTWWRYNEVVKRYLKEGPYVYELFSVMVHSGSAAGGHYYAYIKSFEDNQWYSFNDQIVTAITHEDIEKTYGGSPSNSRTSSYYSAYSSSTNAYMLMYRQIHHKDNANFMKTVDLPPHILKLLEQEEIEERQRQLRFEMAKNMCSIRLFCRHPSLSKGSAPIAQETFEFHKDTMLPEAVKQACQCLNLDNSVIGLGQCRLVKYDHINDVLDRSYDLDAESSESTFSQLLGGVRTTYLFDLLLETREKNEVFERYERGGVTVKVYAADHENACFHNPVLIRSVERYTVHRLKTDIAQRLNFPLDRLLAAYEKYCGECHLLRSDHHTLKHEGFFRSAKVYVDLMTDEEMARLNAPIPLAIQLEDTALWTIIDKMANVMTINILLPPEIPEEQLSNPPFAGTTPVPTSPKASARGPASPSSDEGVGSLGDNGDSTPSRNNEVSREISSPSANSVTSIESGSPTKTQEPDSSTTESQEQLFWKIPEISGEASSSVPTQAAAADDSGFYKEERKRNNSCDDDLQFPTNFVELQDRIQEKLEGYASAISPTSSLRCEDSGSSHSGQNSFITDIDFEADDLVSAPQGGALETVAGAVGSENGSLSTSCSTLDSTDTLCNTSEPCKLDSEDSVTTSLPRFGVMTAYPGRAVSCVGSKFNEGGVSDYNKALRYADDVTGSDEPKETVHFKETRLGVAGSGDPTDSTPDTEKAQTHSTPGPISAAGKCAPCGCNKTSPHDGPKSSDANQTCQELSPSTGIEPASSVQTNLAQTDPNDTGSDPDSGEGMDKLKPLFSDGNTSNPPALTNHCQPLSSAHSCENRPNRERTVSSSSVASDGWGVASELIHKHDFFKIVSDSMNSSPNKPDSNGCKVISVEIDKRMTLLGLKRHLAPIIGTPTRRFCVYRQYVGGQETEVTTPTDTFHLVNEGSKFVVRLGRALRKDEYRCKFYLLALDEEETSKPFMNWVLQRGMTVEVARKLLSVDMAEECDVHQEPDRIRLRKKTWRSPGQIYLPTDVFGSDISLYGSLEFFVEFLDQPEVKQKKTDLVVLSRRWFPSEMRFGDFHEILVSEDEEEGISYLGYSIEHLAETVTKVSGIPQEHVRMAKGRGIFPYRFSVLSAESELEWFPTQTRSHPFQMVEDGVIMFYKDNREKLKECSEEERREIEKEEQKYDSTASTSKYSASSNLSPVKPAYRREKPLKIYTVDTAPTTSNASSEILMKF